MILGNLRPLTCRPQGIHELLTDLRHSSHNLAAGLKIKIQSARILVESVFLGLLESLNDELEI